MRVDGIQELTGSIPVRPTISKLLILKTCNPQHTPLVEPLPAPVR